MIYVGQDALFPVVLICALVIWYFWRKEKKETERREEEKRRKNEEYVSFMRERTRQREEEEEEQKRIHQAYLDTHKCYEIYLTEEEKRKRKFCEKHGDRVDENAMYILYQVLHQPKVEKEELLSILGERKEKYYTNFGLFEDGKEWLEYCKEWLGVGEEEVYAIGIELYRQYLTLDDE